MNNKQSGMALLTIVLFSAVAVVLAAALFFASRAQLSSASRHIRVEKAFFIAEAGVERAKAELRLVQGGFDDVLLGPDGVQNTSDDGILPFGPAVAFGGGEYAVFVVENNEPRMRPVEIGLQDMIFAEVRSGLQPGERVTTGMMETRR